MYEHLENTWKWLTENGSIHFYDINLGEAILRHSDNTAGFKFNISKENDVTYATTKVLELILTSARFDLFQRNILIKSKN